MPTNRAMAWYSARGAQPGLDIGATAKRFRDQVEISSDSSDDDRAPAKRMKTQQPTKRTRTSGGSSSTPAVLSDSDIDPAVIDSNLDPPIPPKQENRKSPPYGQPMRAESAFLAFDYSQFKNKQPSLIPSSPATNWSKSQIKASKTDIDRTRYIHMEERPYYDMENLGVRMYCGKGFEKFHIAVGTLEGLEELCTEWSRKTLAMRHDLQPLPEMSPERKYSLAQDRFVGKAKEIFPDIDPDYLREMFDQYQEKVNGKPLDGNDHALIMDDIMLKPDYPKAVKPKPKQITFEPEKDGTGVKIPVNEEMRERPSYHKQGVIILAWEFLQIPTITIDQVFRRLKTIYAAYTELARLEAQYFAPGVKDVVIRRKKEPRTIIEKKYQLQDRPDQDALPFWLNEVQAAKQAIMRREIKEQREARWEKDEAENRAYHREQNALTVCFICFDDTVPLNRAVPCQGENVHFFCYTCVETHAHTQIGNLKHDMHCCDPGDDSGQCTAPLDRTFLQEVLGKKTMDKLDSIQQATEIRDAQIEGLEQCPFCDYKQIFDSDDVSVVFQCMNPECARLSCRGCRDAAHIPKTCEEVSKERGLSARHLVEEARSEAVIRTCPNCKVHLIKESGCNKMYCVQCRHFMCYICRKDITHIGYDHFGESLGKCKLFFTDNNTELQHEAEANAAQEVAIAQVTAQHANIKEAELRIENGNANNAPAPPNPARPANLGQQADVLQFPLRQPVARPPAQLRPMQPQLQRMQYGANMDGAFDQPAFAGRPAGLVHHAGMIPPQAARNHIMAQQMDPNQYVRQFLAVPPGPLGAHYPELPRFDQQVQEAQHQGYFARIQQLFGRRS